MEPTLKPPKPNPPYLLGLLCLIPLVGAFVGLGLLLYGLLKYKDKWLSVIGVFGILWTIFIYSSLFYLGSHSSFAKSGFGELSQMGLNNLAKSVEFYKLQYGKYPDSLGQLKQEDKWVQIDDPVQGMTMKKSIYYNYKKIGEKYLLFSSGQDGIPNTNDDFYPNFTTTDSSRIGLIRPR